MIIIKISVQTFILLRELNLFNTINLIRSTHKLLPLKMFVGYVKDGTSRHLF